MDRKLGYSDHEEAKRQQETKRSEAVMRNDALFSSKNFRAFLATVADRAGYFAASASSREEWFNGYAAALKDIVNGLIVNSTTGAEWLREYAAGKAAHLTEKKQDE